MLEDIFHCVLRDPKTGSWFGVPYAQTTLGIFEASPTSPGWTHPSKAASSET